MYTTCIHFDESAAKEVINYICSTTMRYLVRELKSDRKRPFSITVHGTKQQLDDYHTFLRQLRV